MCLHIYRKASNDQETCEIVRSQEQRPMSMYNHMYYTHYTHSLSLSMLANGSLSLSLKQDIVFCPIQIIERCNDNSSVHLFPGP